MMKLIMPLLIRPIKKGAISKINSQIRKLLSQFSRASYVGYTATPFANIFIDPDEENFTYTFKEKIPTPPAQKVKRKNIKSLKKILHQKIFSQTFHSWIGAPFIIILGLISYLKVKIQKI